MAHNNHRLRRDNPRHIRQFYHDTKPVESRDSMVRSSPSFLFRSSSPIVTNSTNRLFPYLITVASLALFFILIMLILISRRMLLPGIVLLGSFILFVLFLTGLIETSIQLFGPSGSVNGECSIYIQANPQSGSQTAAQGISTLAWLQQNSICEFPYP